MTKTSKMQNNNMLYKQMQKANKNVKTTTHNSKPCTTNATNIPNK